MKNLPKVIGFLVFLGLLTAFGLATLLLPKMERSELENRSLATVPKLTTSEVFSRRYMNNMEKFLADHFVGRSSWIKLKTRMDLIMGAKEVNGVYITHERLVEKPGAPDMPLVEKSLEAIGDFAEKTGLPTYFLLAPTATEIYRDQLPKGAPAFDQKAFIQKAYSEVQGKSDGVTAIEVSAGLTARREEEIYFRTDHHWTPLGAYEAYSSGGKKLGYTPIPLESFNVEHASSDFLGTLYSKVLYNAFDADTIDLYSYPQGPKVLGVEFEDEKGVTAKESYFFREFLEQKDKYSVYCGENKPRITINTDAPGGKRLLIIKDSYANSMIPFLAQHYASITMLDMRYINMPIGDFVDLKAYDQALFLYNAVTFSTDANVKKVAAVGK